MCARALHITVILNLLAWGLCQRHARCTESADMCTHDCPVQSTTCSMLAVLVIPQHGLRSTGYAAGKVMTSLDAAHSTSPNHEVRKDMERASRAARLTHVRHGLPRVGQHQRAAARRRHVHHFRLTQVQPVPTFVAS